MNCKSLKNFILFVQVHYSKEFPIFSIDSFLFLILVLIAIPSILFLLLTASLKSALNRLFFFFAPPPSRSDDEGPTLPLPIDDNDKLLPPYECLDKTDPDRFFDSDDLKKIKNFLLLSVF